MKFRKDFVTNSSSSSYVCEICGRVEESYEGLSEIGMVECVNGHTICEEEMLQLENRKEIIQFILENEYQKAAKTYSYIVSEKELEELSDAQLTEIIEESNQENCYEIPASLCPICQFVEYSEYTLSKYLEKGYGISRDEVFKEVKATNKRRKKLYESEYINYVCKKYNLEPAKIVATWKEQFGTYDKLLEYLRY